MTDQKRKRLLLLLCWAAFCLTACKGDRNRQEEEKEAVLQRQPYTSLTDSLDHKKGNDRSALYFRRAELLSRNDQHELATEDYGRSWNLRPDPTTGLRYASSLTITGQATKAIRLLEDCRKRFPEDPAFAGMLADLFAQSGHFSDAIRVYDGILRTDSLNSDALYERGLLLEKDGDTASAIGSLKKAFGMEHLNTYGLELAHLYAEKGDQSALPICDDILRRDSAHEMLDPFFIKGIYYSNTGQYKKAIVQFDSCVGRDWKFPDAYLEKGIALFKQKQYGKALESFQMTVKVSETYADGYFWIGRCYEATGKDQQAVAYYQQALALDKTFSE
ncbi:MAG TPA: tetratricopeptide repeat protein, partial [Puia sp.]|nr:tetratricopeptide repeat protein [Puia sp.]